MDSVLLPELQGSQDSHKESQASEGLDGRQRKDQPDVMEIACPCFKPGPLSPEAMLKNVVSTDPKMYSFPIPPICSITGYPEGSSPWPYLSSKPAAGPAS